LETRLCDHLEDDGDTLDSVRRKIDLLLHPFGLSSYDGLGDDQLSMLSDPDSHLSLLTSEQHSVASKSIKAVLHETRQLMFLQGSPGTGKTFTVKALINALQSHRKKCLICGTTGIAAVQYPGRTTLHSLFRLGIDGQSGGCFRSNIGRGTPVAQYILTADLIIIDEISMLTPWVANRVSLTVQSISGYERIQFGGKRILFVGDLLQLPPLFRIFQCPLRVDL
jgi:ATP-dependent exoDNAse (exonuclease V) alpha subunit